MATICGTGYTSRIGGETGEVGLDTQSPVPLAALNKSFSLKKLASVAFVALAFLCLPFAASAVPANGDKLTNTAVLSYDGSSTGVVASSDVTFRPLSGAGNAAPTDIELDCTVEVNCTGGLIIENTNGPFLGNLRVIDPDTGDTHQLSVLDDIRFEIVDGKLRLSDGESIDFENEPTITITLRATDSSGLAVDKVLTIQVRDVNEAPFELSSSNSFIASGNIGGIIGTLSVSDVDAAETHTYSVLGDERFIIAEGNVLKLAPGISLPPNIDIPVTLIATDKGNLTTRLVVVVTTIKAKNSTPSTIQLLAPSGGGTSVDVPAASCSPPASFQTSVPGNPAALGTSFRPENLPGTVQLDVADAYAIGNPVVIRVTDLDQNLEPFIKESVQVEVQTLGAGDLELVTLTESGADTGEFVGYLFTTSKASAVNDCVLTVTSRSQIRVSYVDPNDPADTGTSDASIAPVSIVFDDQTGNPINGVIITLVRVSTGQPAEVRGDGPNYALFPSSIKSGETAKDARGGVYVLGPGEYRFPAIPDGQYRLEIFNGRGWTFSDRPTGELQGLPGSPFSIRTGSRGGVFQVSQGALPRIDVPIKRTPLAVQPSVLTPSTIEFLQYSANPAVGTPVNVGPTACVTGQQQQISELKDVSVPVPGTVNLVPTTVFKAGQPIFIRVTDKDQNNDPTVREKIIIQLDVPASGDREFLELTETGPDTGTFVGYVQSTENESETGSCMLGVVKNKPIVTTYTDAFDETDVSDSLVLVDPFGRVFSTRDGRLIDGVTVTLIDTATGQPADVFGDGPFFADYPNPVVTGSVVEDDAGLVYDFPMGEYRFPFVAAGFYSLEFEGLSEELIFPSTASIEVIQGLPGAPFEIVDGSKGDVFEVPVGPALNIDIPVDEPLGEMFVTKTANRELAGIGDFIQYRINVKNDFDTEVGGAQIQDALPPGFRYQKGSLRVGGQRAEDPLIGPDGRNMLIDLPQVGGSGVDVSYVVEITPAASIGPAVNEATIIGDLVASTNTASARIMVRNELFNDKAILVGRVFLGTCPEDGVVARSGDSDGSEKAAPAVALEGVRVFLEDGSYVITDKEGNWHMEGIEPGSHVVQLDVDSLPNRYEVSECNRNSRFAGSAYSQFVDVKGGTLWRADFKVQEKAAPESIVSMSQTLKVDDEGVWVSVKVVNDGPVMVDGVKAIYREPKGWKIVSGTEVRNGLATSAQKSIVGLVFDIGTLNDEAELRFRIEPKGGKPAKLVMPPPNNTMLVLRPRFETRSTRLTAEDFAELDQLIATLQQQEWENITVVGHTDNVGIAPRNRNEFADNEALSLARAQAVAAYLQDKVVAQSLTTVGAGPAFPIADNSTASGRQQNRRVELLVKALPKKPVSVKQVVSAEVLNGESAVRLSFKSVGTAKGMTETNRIPLNRLVGGFEKLAVTVKDVAVGSWDAPAANSLEEVAARDPNAQGFINLKDGDRLGRPITAVKIDLDSRLKPRLSVDGKEIGRDRIGFSMSDDTTGKTLYSYIGVDLGEPGTRVLKLEGLGPFGNARFEDEISIVRVGELFEFRRADSVSDNVADGITPVTLKLKLVDREGEPLNIPQRLQLKGGDLTRYSKNMNLSDFSESESFNFVEVAADGTAKFNPVSVSGTKRVVLGFADITHEFEVFVRPEQREWIMVGIAEGTTAFKKLSGNMQSAAAAGLEEDVETDGRIAFYAKGQVKGEFILTVAYDTDKKRRDALGQVIDPNSYYTLYGDQTGTQYDASSQEKLFLKLEKDQFSALFGDFSAKTSDGELTNYSRRMSGFKTEYESDKFEVVFFASETDQAFIKDEIRGDGTSGLYRLSTRGIVRNSEQIFLQSRDRFHTQKIVEERTMVRHIDYNIDYDTGTLFFKEPIYSQDTAFNPVFIVVDYEVDGEGADELNLGGRVAYKPLKDMEVGLTLVKEGVRGKEGEMAGVDFEYKVSENTEIRAEVAATKNEIDGIRSDGTAYVIEAEHRDSRVDATAYIREEAGAFGLGQQNASESGTRKIGVEGTYSVVENVEVGAEIYRETSLATNLSQDVATSSMQMQGDRYTINTGLRSAKMETEKGDQVSNQVLLGGQYRLPGGKVALNANAETPISGKGEAGDFPKRLRVGLDYKLTESITLKAEQEFTWGDAENTQGTRIGMTTDLWKGGQLVTNVEQQDKENAERLAAVAGLKQTWDMNDNWSFDFGLDRSQTIKEKQRSAPDLKVTTVYSSPDNTDFTAVTFGSRFSQDAWDWATRLEYRESSAEDKINLVSDVIHNLDEGQQLLAKIDVQRTESSEAQSTTAAIQLGYSYRPVDSRWTLFNKLDLSHNMSESSGYDQTSQKIINNLNANYLLSDDTQVALQYGIKYVVDNFDSDEYRGFTDLYGMEVRHDLNPRWDVGFQGSMYNSHNSELSDYSYGLSLGYNMARNVWISLGYNFAGFDDDDFSASEYTSEGIFLKYRVKFDQHTAKSIMGMMGEN